MIIDHKGKQICIVQTTDDLAWCRNYVSDAQWLAVDTETCGSVRGYELTAQHPSIKAAVRNDCVPLGISVSKDSTSGFYIPVCKDPHKRITLPLELFKECSNFMKGLFANSSFKWTTHNGIFDFRLLCQLLSIQVPDTWVFDTYTAAVELDENRSNGLKELAVDLLGEDADEEKRDMMAFFATIGITSHNEAMGKLYLAPIELVGKYAVQDTCLTMALTQRFTDELVQRGMVERFKWKHDVVKNVYIELNTTGWCIDEAKLTRNEQIVRKQLQELLREMNNALIDEIPVIETEELNKSVPISNSYTWKTSVIKSEGFENEFIKTTKKKTGELESTFTTNKLMCDKFIANPMSQGTETAAFIQWDGVDIDSLPQSTRDLLRSLQKKMYLERSKTHQEEKGQIVNPYVFKPSSSAMLIRVLYEMFKLPINKLTESGNPSTDSKSLGKLVTYLEEQCMTNDQKVTWIEMEKATWLDKAKFLKSVEPALKWKTDPTHDLSISQERWDLCRALVFIVLLAQYKDLSKTHGTYLNGLNKFLYSSRDLHRKPMYSPHAENGIEEVKYLISNMNPSGACTSRVTSSSPNLNNLPSIVEVKETFVAPHGYVILSADLSAQEVRVAATLAHDSQMKDEVFTNKCNKCGAIQDYAISLALRLDYDNALGSHNKDASKVDASIKCAACGSFNWSEPDPHSLVASRIYPELSGWPLSRIKKERPDLRQKAKIVGFQILYGATAMAIADSVFGDKSKENVDKAQALIDTYLKGAPDLARAIEETKEKARRTGYIQTLGGYRRHLPELLETTPVIPHKPKLDEETEKLKCFGWADSLYDPSDEFSEKIGKCVCPRQDEETGKITCPYLSKCQATFRAKNHKRQKMRAERQAFNAAIQGFSSDITNEGLLLFVRARSELAKKDPMWKKVRLVGNIYDACYLYAPEQMNHKEVYKVLIHSFESAWADRQYVKQILQPEAPATNWGQCH